MKIKTVVVSLLLTTSLTSVGFAADSMLQLSNSSQSSVEIIMSASPGEFSEFLGTPIATTTEPIDTCVLGANSNVCTTEKPSNGVEYQFTNNHGNDSVAVQVESAQSGQTLCAFTLVFGASPSVVKPTYHYGNSTICPVDGDGSYLHITINQ